jgi:hypothetical protein
MPAVDPMSRSRSGRRRREPRQELALAEAQEALLVRPDLVQVHVAVAGVDVLADAPSAVCRSSPITPSDGAAGQPGRGIGALTPADTLAAVDDRLRDNQQVLALVAGVALLGVGLLVWIADATTYAALGLALVLIGAAFIALGLFGDRITEMTAGAFGFKMVARRFTERAKQVIEGKAELRAQASVTATADVVSKESHDEGRGEDRTDGPVVITPEPAKLKLQTFPPEVRVERRLAPSRKPSRPKSWPSAQSSLCASPGRIVRPSCSTCRRSIRMSAPRSWTRRNGPAGRLIQQETP